MSLMPNVTHSLLEAVQRQPAMRAHNVICIHTMVGSLAGTDGMFHANGWGGTESHYGTGGHGEIIQWQDTRYTADANLDGNGDVISIENADLGPGFAPWNTADGSAVPAFTDDQFEAIARIIAWESSPAAHAACPSSWDCHREGIPLVLIPDTKPGRRGVGYHAQGVPGNGLVAGGVAWSSARGKVCPGARRIAQVPALIARAKTLRTLGTSRLTSPASLAPPHRRNKMFTFRDARTGSVHLANPATSVRIDTPTDVDKINAALRDGGYAGDLSAATCDALLGK